MWLDSGDTIIRGTGMQIQYKYVTLNRALFLENIFSTSLCIRVDFFTVDCLALELQQLFSVSQWKTAIFVWAAA